MDTLSLATNSSITEEQIDILNRIRRNIKRSENEYALYFIECNLPNLRKQLINELKNTNELNLLTLNITDYPKDEGLHIDEWVNEQKIEYQNKNNKQLINGISIVGLEQLLPTGSDEQIIKTVSELNWRRSYFQTLKVPIMFWLPSYALALLANQASDFYDWYSDIYHFESDLEQKKLAVSQQLSSLRHPKTNISAQHYQTLAEKEAHLKTIKSLLDETTTLNDKAYVRTLMADLLHSMGRLNEALKYWEEALEIAIQMNNKMAQQAILNNISQVYQSKRDYDKALEYLTKAQNLDPTISNGAISNNISLIHTERGDYKSALEELEKSINLDAETIDDTALTTRYMNIGSIYYKTEEYDKALHYMNKALNISRKIGDKLGLCHCLNGIASIYHDRDNKDMAFKYLKQALEICEELGDKVLSSIVLYNIASIYYEQGNFETTLKYLNKSLSISREIDDIESIGTTLSTIDSVSKFIN